MQTVGFPRVRQMIGRRVAFPLAFSFWLFALSLCLADGRQPIAVTPELARDWEMQLELELLGDPLTFPYVIKPQVTPAGMEIRGRVANVWVRDHAMKLARSLSPVVVVDAMTVDAKMLVPVPQPQSSSFAAEARSRLQRTGVRLIGPVEIKAAGNGTITLSGQIGSVEEKLKMTRALRGLPGCICVKNELAVAATPAAAKEVARAAEPAKPVPAKPTELSQRMPPSPVAPIPGTLQQETNLPSSDAAQVRFDEEAKPPAVVQTSAKPDSEKQKDEGGKTKPIAPEAGPPLKSEPALRPLEHTKEQAKMPKGPPSVQVQAAIQKKLKSILGRNARDISMQFDDKGGARITVKVSKLADVEKVHAAVQQSPDLAGYDVNLEFVVGP